MHVDLQRLADYVRRIRKQKGLNQEDIRARGGPSTGWLGALEAGSLPSEPKPATLEKLASGLGVPLNDIYTAAGYHEITDSQVRAMPFNNLDDRMAYLLYARKEKYPPTQEEEDLIRAYPDSFGNQSYFFGLSLFDDPPSEQRKNHFVPGPDEIENGTRAEELRRLLEVTSELPPNEREEVLEYARMRLRRLQEKRKE